ncbi:adenylyltransferase/cytidyltransferase family protein [Candidatus Saccharibacteria bacterium]|nr:adenylyltransferase/cytidyltransferase family protein [Candidatus Saccharibacteria bacterium]
MIIKASELTEFRKKHENEKIVYCGGVFDLLHLGHLDVLKELRATAGDKGLVVVGVTPDSRVKHRKGETRPAHDQETRIAVIDALRYVDCSFISPERSKYEFIGYGVLKDLKPNVFITADDVWEQERAWLQEQGTQLKIIPRFSEEISTTITIRNIVKKHS